MNCEVLNCNNIANSFGLCTKHYLRKRRYGSTELPKSESTKLLEQCQKRCSKCRHVQDVRCFAKDRTTFTGFSALCKSCRKQAGAINYQKYKLQRRNHSLQKQYGITLEQYLSILQQQNNCCCICKIPLDAETNPPLDHCHKTGKVRGILCGYCNRGLGHFRDNPDFLFNARNYLLRN